MNFIRIKGYLKNITNNEIIIIDTELKKNNNKYIYTLEDAMYQLIIDKADIYIIRENKDIKSIMKFSKDKFTTCDYALKKEDINLQIELKTIKLTINPTKIFIKYKVENMDIYEYLVEIEE